MKRSKSLTLTAMVAGGGLTLSACGRAAQSTQSASTGWTDGSSSAAAAADDGRAYASVEECRASGEQPEGACDQAYSAALADQSANAPQFADRASCEAQFGAEQCQPRQGANGGTIFLPLLAAS